MELRISSITKVYENSRGGQRFALTTPEITLTSGTILCVMGRNGSGKSVFMRMIAGEEEASGTPVRLSDGTNSWSAHARPCSIIRQNVEQSLATDLTVEQNLFLRLGPGSMLGGLEGPTSRNIEIEALLKQHPALLGKLRQQCRGLSGGQKQALAFIGVTCNRTTLLILDEFLSSADFETSAWLMSQAIQYAKRTPACVVIVTHDVGLAIANATRIIILRNGSVIEDLSRGDTRWNAGFVRDAITAEQSSN